MRLLLLILSSLMLGSQSWAQSAGDVQLGVKSSAGPLTPVWITKTPSRVIGWDSSGTLGPIIVSSSTAWGDITGSLSAQSDLQTALNAKLSAATAASTYQPLDSDLTSIAALTTTSYGRSLLTQADASAARSTLGLGTLATQSATLSDYLLSATAASTYQPLDSDLTSIAALTTTSYGRSLLTQGDASTARSTLGLGTLATQSATLSDYQLKAGALALGGFSSITGTLSAANGGTGITALASGMATFLGAASSANLAGVLTDETGTGKVVFNAAPEFDSSLKLTTSAFPDEWFKLSYRANVDNASVPALYVSANTYYKRIFIGDESFPAIMDFRFSGIENVPGLSTNNGLWLGFSYDHSIRRGDGGIEIAANNSSDYGIEFFQNNGWASPAYDNRVARIHRNGIQYYGTKTSSQTNWEGVELGYSSSAFHLWSLAGASGGYARDLILGYDEQERLRLTNDGVKIGSDGATIKSLLLGTASLDFSEIAADSVQDQAVIVTGAQTGEVVLVGASASAQAAGIVYSAWVSSADYVTIRATNTTGAGVDPSGGTFTIFVIHQ